MGSMPFFEDDDDEIEAQESLETLSSVPFLSLASPKTLAQLAARLELREEPEGSVLFRQGDASDRLFVVRNGVVRITRHDDRGQIEKSRKLYNGQLFGELGILSGQPRTATAETLAPTQLWELEREDFIEAYDTDPSVHVEVSRGLAHYVMDSDVVAEELLFIDLEGRLARRILASAHEGGQQGPTLDLSIDVAQLAKACGGTGDTVGRILGELEQAGVLSSASGPVRVLDLDALVSRAKL